MNRPFKVRTRCRSTFSVTRYPFIPNCSSNQSVWQSGDESGDGHGDQLSFNNLPESSQSQGDCLTCQSYQSETSSPALTGRGDGKGFYDTTQSSAFDLENIKYENGESANPSETSTPALTGRGDGKGFYDTTQSSAFDLENIKYENGESANLSETSPPALIGRGGGGGDGKVFYYATQPTDLNLENIKYENSETSESEKSCDDTEVQENYYSRESNETTAKTNITSESPQTSNQCSPREKAVAVLETPLENQYGEAGVFFTGTKSTAKPPPPTTPSGRKLSYGEMEAKLQALIIGKFARRKKSELEALGFKSPLLPIKSQPLSNEDERRPSQTAISGTTVVTQTETSFHSSDWPFVSYTPPKKPLKPVLANFDKIDLFQAPFRRLPTPWLHRPETPLQRIYGSIVKQMPMQTERDRRKLIETAVLNGKLYKRIKRVKSEYSRHEQLKNFKKHEAFIKFKGPVANVDNMEGKRNRFLGPNNSNNFYCYKPEEEGRGNVCVTATETCDFRSNYEDESPEIAPSNQ